MHTITASRLHSLLTVCAALVAAACAHVPLAYDVNRELGVGRYAPVPADSVRVVQIVTGPDWQTRLTDSISAPYEVLASVETRGAGGGAAEAALAQFRRRVGEAGGNVGALLWVRRSSPPYTVATGHALRVLPPMPDAASRCEQQLTPPDSAAARVVACREAARLAPSDPTLLRNLAVAYLTLAQRGSERRENGLAIQSAWGDAGLAAARAARLDAAYGTPRPYLPGMVRLFGGDSLRAYQALAILFSGSVGTYLPEGALAANREVIRLSPDSASAYIHVVTLLLRQKRAEEALRVAAAYARRQPNRVEGWAGAAVAANALGDHVRAMRFWGRVLEIDPRYFRLSFIEPYGRSEYVGSEQRAGKQPPATVGDLP